MADMFTAERRSAIMAAIRSTGNKTTEMRFIQILRRHRLSGWRRGSFLVGRPDFVFRRQRLAVFIDGDFWHGNPKKYRLPKSNMSYWQAKISRNQKRDRRVNRQLRGLGWSVVRFWESTLKEEARVVQRLSRYLKTVKTQQKA